MCHNDNEPGKIFGCGVFCLSIAGIFIAGYLWTTNCHYYGNIAGILAGCLLITAGISCIIPNRCFYTTHVITAVFPTHVYKTFPVNNYDTEEGTITIISEK